MPSLLNPEKQEAEIWSSENSQPPVIWNLKYTIHETQISFNGGPFGNLFPPIVELQKDVSRGVFLKGTEDKIFWQTTKERKESITDRK